MLLSLGAKLALRQKTEEAAVNSASAAVTTSTVTSNNVVTEPTKQEKPQESNHETKDSIKEADANKPKKEEATPKEAAKPQDKSRPISSTPVPGTPWYKINLVIFTMVRQDLNLNCLLGVLFGRATDAYFFIIPHRVFLSGKDQMISLVVKMSIKWYLHLQMRWYLLNRFVNQIQVKVVMMINQLQRKK